MSPIADLLLSPSLRAFLSCLSAGPKFATKNVLEPNAKLNLDVHMIPGFSSVFLHRIDTVTGSEHQRPPSPNKIHDKKAF